MIVVINPAARRFYTTTREILSLVLSVSNGPHRGIKCDGSRLTVRMSNSNKASEDLATLVFGMRKRIVSEEELADYYGTTPAECRKLIKSGLRRKLVRRVPMAEVVLQELRGAAL